MKHVALTAAQVLRRYKDEDLPAFSGMDLKDVNQVGLFGEHPLDVAACRGSVEEIAALLEAGANVNSHGELGNTPLHEAVSQNHLAAIQFLVEHGASLTARNNDGKTPLALAKTRAAQTLLLRGRIDRRNSANLR